MVELDSRVETRTGVALVELVVRNPTATARRFRVGNRLDGPVWPPRREGVPTAGWDDGGFEGVVAAEDRRALGYASPVSSDESTAEAETSPDEPPSEPPAELVWTERAGDSESPDSDATPEGVVRSLGDPRPPADAVPAPGFGESERSEAGSASNPAPEIPDPVESWFASIEERTDENSDTPGPEDRRALGAIVRRIDRLRDPSVDSRRSRSP
jgi:hypothetical protein